MISFAKKFLSIALALILLVGVFPTAAFAAATESVEVTAIQADALDLGVKAFKDGTNRSGKTFTIEKGKCLTAAMVTEKTGYTGSQLRFPGRPEEPVASTPVTTDCFVIIAPKAEHDHVYGEWIVDKEATVEADGSKHQECSICGHKNTETIKKLTPAETPEEVKPVIVKVPIYKGAHNEQNLTKLVYEGVEGQPVDMVKLNAFIDDPALVPGEKMEFSHWEFGDGTRPGRDRGIVNQGRHLIIKYRPVSGETLPETKPDTKPDTKPENNGSIHQVTLDFKKAQFKDITIRVANGERIATLLAGDKLPMKSTEEQIMIGWEDAAGNKITNETYYDYATHGTTLYAVWRDAAVVTVKYFVNNKFDRPAYEINLPFVAVGEDYDISPEYLLKQYKNGYHNAKRLDGPYSANAWERYEWNYRHGKKANGTVEVIQGIGGPDGNPVETVLYCMVFDDGYNPNSKPDASNPKTGDSSMIYATTAVMLISAGALAVFFMDRKRRNG